MCVKVLHMGTWRPLRDPDKRLWGQGHPWCHGWSYFTLRNIPWTMCEDISNGSCVRKGGQEGGTWRTLSVPDWSFRRHGHSWCHGDLILPPRKLPWKFCVDIFIRSVSGMWVQKGASSDLGNTCAQEHMCAAEIWPCRPISLSEPNPVASCGLLAAQPQQQPQPQHQQPPP